MAEAFFASPVSSDSTSQVANIRAKFDAIDANKDGKVSKQELEDSMIAEGVSAEIAHQWVNSFFNHYDADFSGFVTIDEFSKAMAHSPPKALPPLKKNKVHMKDLKRAFYAVDDDEDGLLSKTELVNLLVHVGESQAEAQQQANDVFTLFKAADDATIEFDHFYAEYKRMRDFKVLVALKKRVSETFTKADHNADGKLSREELLEVLISELGEEEAKYRLEDMFTDIDTNNDGTISNKELFDWYEKTGKKQAKAARKAAKKRAALPPVITHRKPLASFSVLNTPEPEPEPEPVPEEVKAVVEEVKAVQEKNAEEEQVTQEIIQEVATAVEDAALVDGKTEKEAEAEAEAVAEEVAEVVAEVKAEGGDEEAQRRAASEIQIQWRYHKKRKARKAAALAAAKEEDAPAEEEEAEEEEAEEEEAEEEAEEGEESAAASADENAEEEAAAEDVEEEEAAANEEDELSTVED